MPWKRGRSSIQPPATSRPAAGVVRQAEILPAQYPHSGPETIARPELSRVVDLNPSFVGGDPVAGYEPDSSDRPMRASGFTARSSVG